MPTFRTVKKYRSGADKKKKKRIPRDKEDVRNPELRGVGGSKTKKGSGNAYV